MVFLPTVYTDGKVVLGTGEHLRVKHKSNFRTSAFPQRRVYVFYGKSNRKIASVMYWKLGENETFSKHEIQFLTSLNQGHGSLVTQISENGSEFEVSTPKQFPARTSPRRSHD